MSFQRICFESKFVFYALRGFESTAILATTSFSEIFMNDPLTFLSRTERLIAVLTDCSRLQSGMTFTEALQFLSLLASEVCPDYDDEFEYMKTSPKISLRGSKMPN